MKTKQSKHIIAVAVPSETSIAYHRQRPDDVMLLERDELTSGSTWHAAGLLPLFNMSYATTHIHKYPSISQGT
jgi:dimethylglycine dehydrogenase